MGKGKGSGVAVTLISYVVMFGNLTALHESKQEVLEGLVVVDRISPRCVRI